MNKIIKLLAQSVLVAVVIGFGFLAIAQEYTVNMQKADLLEFIDEVSTITKRTFVVDERVRGEVTIISERKLNAEGVFTLLESVLRVHGYAVIDDGEVARIVQLPNAKTWSYPTEGGFDSPDRMVTQVIQLNYVSSAEASRVLRLLVSQYGHLAAVNNPNVLVISDHAGNVASLVQLVKELDRLDAEQSIVIPMKHAWVRDVANMLEQIHPEMMRSETASLGLIAFANENNNTLFLRGKPGELAIATDTIAQLDQPYKVAETTRVFNLQHADAEPVATVLTGLLNIEPTDQTPGAATESAEVSIQADTSNNAILVRGNPAILSDVVGIIEKMDREKLQVLIESAIVEVTIGENSTSGIELGGADDSGERVPLATTSITGILSNLLGTLIAEDSDQSQPGLDGLQQLTSPTLAVARLDPNGVSFAAIINALTTHSKADLLSTPHVIALDNEESEIFHGSQVPFRTGTFGVTREQGQTPLSTIERQDVGISLTVTPKIRDDLSVKMTVATEVDAVINPSLGIGESGFSDIVTSKRRVNTTVVANDGQTIVLGGLIKDDVNTTIRKVPLIGSIPLLGRLFRTNSTLTSKSHLLIFLRPTVIQSDSDIEGVVDRKINGIWQLNMESGVSSDDAATPTPGEIYEGIR